MAFVMTDTNFDELVLNSDKPVLIDFSVYWSVPCKMAGRLVEEISPDYDGRAIVGKVDVDQNPAISGPYEIPNTPALLYCKNGAIVDN
ncbi:thiol reductase thioredoxin [Dyadobacter frigoris]|uniref:Thiol reductase thioredoxin n=2 Tax=Dyadobacter frigoris TaxID=2576211 RepID=A0A4U6D7G9_9BACT|nr:thiol reductase thioredoxin [Dyadobacter frigoris]